MKHHHKEEKDNLITFITCRLIDGLFYGRNNRCWFYMDTG